MKPCFGRNMRFSGLGAMTAATLLLVCWAAHAAPTVSDVTPASTQVGRYEVFRADFAVDTVATNLFWPYDASPPSSITAGAGASVDVLFSDDGWATSVTVPAFYMQDYTRVLVSGTGSQFDEECVTPVGSPRWQVRFSPTRVGNWRYKIQVQDSSGTTTYPAAGDLGFECVASTSHGFVQTSRTDSRYFELSDGTPLIGPGVNGHFQTTYQADSLLATYGANGVKTVRWWMDFREWQNPFGGGASNPQWSFMLTMANTGGHNPGDRYCGVLASGRYAQQRVYLTQGVLYRLTGYVRTADVAGTGAVGYIGSQQSTPITGTADWTRFSVDTIPTSTGRVYIGCRNFGTSGTVYFDDLSLRASGDGGQTWSGEYLSKGDFDFENYIDLAEAWKVDKVFDAAARNGVYLKTVISEKQDYTLGCIGSDGSTMSRSDSNFYATEGHPSRWLQKAYWRYLTARWGAYTSRHSWELCNEGDPNDTDHFSAANALASTVHSLDPNKGLCTTSFWHSVPMEFWKSSACDYLDVHEYFGPTTPETVSHGYRYHAWVDDKLMPMDDATGSLVYDTSVYHSGRRSVRLDIKAVDAAKTTVCGNYHTGIDPAHTYTVRYWVKADNVGNAGGVLWWTKPGLLAAWSKAYAENDFVAQGRLEAPLGTYDWQRVEITGVTPPAGANTLNISLIGTGTVSHTGAIWFDDVEVIDDVTGRNIFVDGGFEGDRIDYDSALAVQKYGVLLDSYGARVGKPAIWGETGIRGPNAYGSPYKGFTYTEENQQLVDDTNGVYLKKMIWAHAGPDNPYMLLWWTDNIPAKNLWGYFKAFQTFMAGIPVSSGSYRDAAAQSNNLDLRAWGQKDVTNSSAHLWIDNAAYTWKSVVDGVQVPPVSGQITLTGLKDATYRVEWWDTATGTVARTEDLVCENGTLKLDVSNLQSDTACRISLLPAKIDLRIIIPSADVVPGQIVTVTVEYTNVGELEARNATLTAQVPAELDYVTGSAEETGGTWHSANGSITWTVDSLAPHQTGQKTFRAKVR